MRLVWTEETGVPLYVQLYDQIRDDIVDRKIPSGTKLPSSRKLAADLRISRNTVELAYNRLYSEGFLVSKPRSGNFALLPGFSGVKNNGDAFLAQEEVTASVEDFRYDFRPGKTLHNEFPFRQWQKMVNRCFEEYQSGFLQYGCPFGEPGLRSEIQKFLWNYRQIQCQARQIIVGTGTQFFLEALCDILPLCDAGVCIEDPGYGQTRATFQKNGVPLCPVGLDAEGICVPQAESCQPAAIYTTPSCQFPTGVTMSLPRRRALISWAERTSAYILEDDHNCCYQYDRKMIPALRSMCEKCVIYLGTFSDTTFPGLRVSYMVLPICLIERLCNKYCYEGSFVPFLTQKPLELFMREGHWESHVRKAVKHQREKRDRIVTALETEFGNRVKIHAKGAGLHLLVEAQWDTDEEDLVQRAARMGVGVEPVSNFWSQPEKQEQKSVLINYGGIKKEDIPGAVEALTQAWK